jgi:hypothetical protein
MLSGCWENQHFAIRTMLGTCVETWQRIDFYRQYGSSEYIIQAGSQEPTRQEEGPMFSRVSVVSVVFILLPARP